MPIRMRNNSKKESVCCECGLSRNQVLDMFDVQVGDNIFTICDLCNEALFRKTLSASCYTNGRVKVKEDIAIINKRSRNRWKAKELQENLKYSKEETEEIRRKSTFFNGEE